MAKNQSKKIARAGGRVMINSKFCSAMPRRKNRPSADGIGRDNSVVRSIIAFNLSHSQKLVAR